MNEYINIDFILMVVIAILFTFFKKRAENLATKKDIEDLTQKVEKIKTEFLKELEDHRLKASIINKIDNKYLDLLSNYVLKSNSEIEAYKIKEPDRSLETVAEEVVNNEELYQRLKDLCYFLEKYSVRYDSELSKSLLSKWRELIDCKEKYDNHIHDEYTQTPDTPAPTTQHKLDLCYLIQKTHDISSELLKLELPRKF